jgi:hypothetical protein
MDLIRDKTGKPIAYNDLPWNQQQGGHSEHAKAYEAARAQENASRTTQDLSLIPAKHPLATLERRSVFIPPDAVGSE